jgi:ankyrin repeat protein
MRYLLYVIPVVLAAQSAPGDGKLLEAIHINDLAAVRAALKSGAIVNSADELGATPLMHAGAYCSLDCMRVLLAAGADVNATSNAGFTPLMWSVFNQAKVRLLLEKGANVNARAKDGNTALILARQNAIVETPPILLRAGAADEDGMDPQGRPILKMNRDKLIQ